MSKKNGKTAHSAEAQKPSQETKQTESASSLSVPAGQPAQVATPETSIEQQPTPSPLEDLKARMLTPATIEKAKVVGLDLQPLLDYATSLEMRFEQIQKAFQHVGVALDKIAPLADLAERYNQTATAQPQGQPQPQSSGLGGINIPQLLQLFASGGGGGSDETTKWLAEVGKEQIMLSRVVFQEFAKQIVPDVMEKMKAAATAAAALKT